MVIYSHRDKDLITLSCERQTQRWDGVMKINCQRVEVKWRGGDDDDGWQRPRGWWEMTERGRDEKVQQEVMSCCTSRRKYRKSKKMAVSAKMIRGGEEPEETDRRRWWADGRQTPHHCSSVRTKTTHLEDEMKTLKLNCSLLLFTLRRRLRNLNV